MKFKGRLLVFTVLFFVMSVGTSQNIDEFKTFEGKVYDQILDKYLASVHLYVDGTNITTITNQEGKFSLKVPVEYLDNKLVISYLGYKKYAIEINELKPNKNKIFLESTSITLADVNIKSLKDPKGLVKAVFKNKGSNYLSNNTLMKAFYRETIRKGAKNISLSEAIVDIHKSPYTSASKDVLEFYKTRKKTDYSKLDTLAFKLQGGPFNTLFLDIVKYPEYIFSSDIIDEYKFTFKGSSKINENPVYIIHFELKRNNVSLPYEGDLYINYDHKTLVSASYFLDVSNKKDAQNWFSVKKPSQSKVTPTYAKYEVKYFEKDNKWHLGYSRASLGFKVNWKKKLFNSNYRVTSEMAVTNWQENENKPLPKLKSRLKQTLIMADYPIGFADDNFWGAQNVIEPDKSIERAIKKIQKQLL